MKKQIFYTTLILLIGLSSCEDYLDRQPLDQPSSETFLSTEIEVEMGVSACYQYIDNWEGWSSHSYVRELVNLEDAGMIRMVPQFDAFRDGSANSTHSFVTTWYTDYYKGISRCHLTIDGMEKAKEVMNIDKWNQLRSEARVIRAWCYYQLVSKFGSIPFTTSMLEMTDYAELERTPEDQIYTFIIDEIEDAAKYLPVSSLVDNGGRLTQSTAYAIGAKAALYRAFFHDGEAISPDATYLGIVKDWTQKIIDTGVHSLYYDSSDPKNSYRHLFMSAGENSQEVIFQKEFNFSQGKAHEFVVQMGPRAYPGAFAATTPQEYLIHSYEDTLGNTVDKSPYFDPKNPFFGREHRFYQTIVYPRVEGAQDIEVTLTKEDGSQMTLKGFNEVYPGTKFPDAYDNSFIREYKTLLQPWGAEIDKDLDNWHWSTNENGISKISGNADATNPWSSRTGYVSWKYWNLDDWPSNRNTSSLNFMLIRYADILLMNAEARIELNDNIGLAVDYINSVRARGWGMSPEEYISHPSALNSGMGQSTLRAKLRRERKVELCFEGWRYDDLKRYGADQKALSMDVVGRPKFFHLEASTNIPQIDGNGVVSLPWLEGADGQAADYPNRWWMASHYQAHFNRWPIPQSEFDNGKILTNEDQNPGY